MIKQILVSLDSISPLILLLYALTSGQVAWRRDYIFWFIAAQAFFNSVALVLEQVFQKHNLFVYHANCAVSFFILSLYFFHLLHLKKKYQLILAIYLLFTLFFMLNLILWEGLSSFNSNTFGLACFILVTYCFLYYLENLMHPASFYISRTRDFWYVTGIFTYYATNFYIFIPYRYLTQTNIEGLGVLWQVHNVVFLIMCIYFFVGILCKPSQEKYRF